MQENSVKWLFLQIAQRLAPSLVSKGWYPVKETSGTPVFSNLHLSHPLGPSCLVFCTIASDLSLIHPLSSLYWNQSLAWHPSLALTGLHPSVFTCCQKLLVMTLNGKIAGILTRLPWFQQKTAPLSQSKTYKCSIFPTKITTETLHFILGDTSWNRLRRELFLSPLLPQLVSRLHDQHSGQG